FNRRRYRADTSAPKRDAIALYGYLNGWALEQYGDSDTPNPSLLVLAEQARRIRDLLEALPEQRISFLELERIVRTIYEPSPAQYSPAEAGSFGYVHQPGAIAAPVDMLIWWNCLHTQGAPPPERWSAAERAFLEMQGLRLRTPRQESQWQLLRQQRPVLQTARRLVLVVPDYADGAEAVPNLLLGDIEAAFPEAKSLQYCLDEAADRERLAHIFALPAPAQVPVRSAARPRPHLLLSQPEALAESEYETPTSLETLFYYPHRWFFRQRLRMFRSALLAISADETLKGNLAHRFFEMLLVRDDLPALQRQAVYDWVEDEAPALLEREGATLLLYGREPERKAFLTKVKNAAWSLISLIRSNGWSVLHTELDLEGHFAQIPVRGKADLVLGRGEERAIVDLKWGGTNRRKELIKNGEDLQLVLYAHLLPPPEQWPHTAYFILEEGKIVARTAAAFREAIVPGSCDDHAAAAAQIFARMERTFRWRMEQLQQGMVEVRTARTLAELEALYEGQLLDFLEMKAEESKWDDYRTLVG
ncbi:MAG TPA: PD-(D/E)XK nuclease family protein, partial [Saprospiraceae bacterium]|nr:PD-(D/E)XK nuclease family protein [Saprospiraceae bacterium]